MAASSTQDAINPTTDMATYMDRFQKAFLNMNGHIQALPEDLKFEMSMDRSFAKRLTTVQERLRALTGNLLEVVANEQKAVIPAGGKMKSRKSTKDEDEDMFTEFSGQVQDSIDGLLEKTNIQLDVHTGKRKQPVPAPTAAPSTSPAEPATAAALGPLPKSILHANIPKPQARFDVKVDNSADLPPWTPSLKTKAHSMVPLDYRSTTPPPDDLVNAALGSDGDAIMPLSRPIRVPVINPLHPYYFETKHLPYPSSLFTVIPPIEPRSFAETPYTYVSSPKQYSAMVQKLLVAKELAVDLEYHSTRSFSGFLCLMQISTRDEDFVVDLLTLRKEVREDKLGGVLVDPSIVKVFHGAESDIVWLQQDFDIYVVGLFDTYHATKILQYPSHSLASLLQLYCSFAADKRYQMADWRIRPLPEDMVHYARSDTHFLLYVFDHLRNTLIERSGGTQTLIRQVLNFSEETATKLHHRTGYDFENGTGANGWRGLANRLLPRRLARDGSSPEYALWGPGELGYQTERIFKRVHAWRDATARREDESPNQIMQSQVLWTIACRPPASVLALAPMLPYQANLARSLREELFKVIQEAKEEGSKLFAEHQAAIEASRIANLEDSMDVDMIEGQGVGHIISDHEAHTSRRPGPTSSAQTLAPALSTLFGSTINPSNPTIISATGASTSVPSGLFGTLLQSTAGAAGDLRKQHKEAFLKVIQNFNSSNDEVAGLSRLAVPLAPTSTSAVPFGQADLGGEDIVMLSLDTAPAPTQPEQIPYVKPVKKDKDEVVQVSKPKKKRKRAEETIPAEEDPSEATTTIAETSQAGTSSSREPSKSKVKKERKAPVKSEDVPEFSYANESNSLDIAEKEDSGTTRKMKVKKVKKPVVDTSGFRMPPQNPQDKLAGNKARTF